MPGLRAFVTSFLFYNRSVLLLQRREDAAFAPGLWTGVGGKVCADELGDLTDAALREVREETGIEAAHIRNFGLEAILTQPEGGDVVVLAFFAGKTDRTAVEPCPEGELHWVHPADLDGLNMIANARCALGKIIEKQMDRGVWFGVCLPDTPDRLRDIFFAEDRWCL